ncbi:MAG: neutral zinc metallopeptidase [Bacteroidaceae bacterium]|nr:neutral zinc metallopeptidase [Bacteroidaceae bacterium]
MNLSGRRESSNVDDRRRFSGGKAGGIGIIGIIIAVVIAYLTNGGDLFRAVMQSGALDNLGSQGVVSERELTAEEEELAHFSKQVLASTEDVWTHVFQSMGRTYVAPRMVLYTGAVQTGCGQGSASVGPFYCSADQALYIDLSFFSNMKSSLGADGDFAYAYVIAHEVGHHVQYLLGTLDECHNKMARLNQTDANKISVRLELQADFYAGVWGYYENDMYRSLEDGDLQEAIQCAEVIGDNYLQEKAQGYSQPETFTHGTSAQRMQWLKMGLTTGDMSRGEISI